MSDGNSTYGEPVDDSESVDDVVGRAHEGLAEAEAAKRDAVPDAEAERAGAELPADASPTGPTSEYVPDDAATGSGSDAADTDRADTDRTDTDRATPDSASSSGAGTPWYDRTDDPDVASADSTYTPGDFSAGTARSSAADAEPAASRAVASEPERTGPTGRTPDPVVVEPIAAAPVEPAGVEPEPEPAAVADHEPEPAVAEPLYVAPVAVEPAAAAASVAAPVAQPIFVQAPEAPRPRGNRGAAGAIGLLAAVVFAALYLGVELAIGLAKGSVTTGSIGTAALNALGTWSLWVPVAVFFIAFWLLGAILNRARWGYWVVFGLLVGLASYGGHILGQLFQAPFWNLTAREGATLVEAQLFAPLAIAAFIIGRELTIWFGAWVAARGRRITEINIEAQREYERTLEAGPQLVRA